MKRVKMIAIFIAGVIFLTGCQTTPEKSSVAGRADGLDQEVTAEPLKEGETVRVALPDRWKDSEKRSNDRVILSADLTLDEITVGNLPVIEMENRALTDQELEHMVRYFAGEDTLYQPCIDTKQDYQEVIKRIREKSGAYAEPNLVSYYQSQVKYLENAAELAPEENFDVPLEKIRFQKKTEDPARFAAAGIEVPEEHQYEIYFNAEAGEERTARIDAQNYSAEAGMTSIFSWTDGDLCLNESDLESLTEQAESRFGDSQGGEYERQWLDILTAYREAMQQGAMDMEEGEKQAKQILEDLEIRGVELSSAERTLWFPKETFYPKGEADQFLNDQIWRADPKQAETGYLYVFTRGQGGLFTDQMEGSVIFSEVGGSYAPPFPVEKVSVAVTASGVKFFEWDGICREVGIDAENTRLLPFEEIQQNIFDYLYYRHLELGQPENSKSVFEYAVSDIRLGYTYVPAYGNPEHAWLVPAWFVKAAVHADMTEDQGKAYDWISEELMVNALDGGLIAKQR